MKINKRYSIEKDSFNFIVVKRTKNKGSMKDGKRVKPKTKWKESRKYYPTLLLACLSVTKNDIDIKNMETIILSIEKSTKDIKKAFKKVKNEN